MSNEDFKKLADAIAEDLSGGDALAVRSADGYIAAGVVSEYTPAAECSEGDLVAALSDPVMWRVRDGRAEALKLDHGPTIDYRYDDGRRRGAPEDWDGPSVTIGIGLDTGEVILRRPDPVFDNKGVRYYFPEPAGAVVAVSTGALAAPSVLLDPDETLPSIKRVER